jgi:hypothetical protein
VYSSSFPLRFEQTPGSTLATGPKFGVHFIFVECPIAHVMQPIFDRPMLTMIV